MPKRPLSWAADLFAATGRRPQAWYIKYVHRVEKCRHYSSVIAIGVLTESLGDSKYRCFFKKNKVYPKRNIYHMISMPLQNLMVLY